MVFDTRKRNPLFYLIQERAIHPELKIEEFRAKVKTYLEIYSDLDNTEREMLQALLNSLSPYYKDENF
ncbi:MAG: hypothetical protein NZO16_00815 [Deltaproteobacteria bacterium]|nr:hypothetical protein [Deltaproteobacteria bacterium]